MKLNLDFSKVKDTAESVAPGTYKAKVEEITKVDGDEAPSGHAYLKWSLKILTGSAKGLHINHITTLKPDAMFGLKNTLEACGYKIPKSAVSLDIAKVLNKELGIEVKNVERNGKTYPNVSKTFKASEFIDPSNTLGDVIEADAVEDDDIELEIPS